ncbi:LysR family transcriptional regulator [Bordetella genomosp. 10]|uniref:LysR family transcriptional regulator n=1 Tax=Bordetella genomosp. 10 TaxID=1416804 RepID=A0A261SB56_9BORD|nr:LysR substrate-binding domain-containing protein [Bordetella genomosp. 10]OZI34311.1 LysR family transcriptional regulator [Bordetella genomosp. 10]
MNPRTLTPSMSLLLAFESSARHLSYTKAAAELSLTQSAVSRQVQALQDLLRIQLFERKGRAIALTDAGRIYMREVGMAIGRIRNATLQVTAMQAGGGSIDLALLPTFGARWLMPRLHAFYAGHPKVLVHLHSRIGDFDLEAAGMDAVIRVAEGPAPGLVSHRLLEERMVLVASPALLEKHPVAGPDDLRDVLLLRVASRANIWSEWFDAQGGAPRQLCFGPTFEVTSHLIQAVATGIGVGLVPDFLVEEELASGQLAAPIGYRYASGKHYQFAYPAHKSSYAPLAAFRDWLLGTPAARP